MSNPSNLIVSIGNLLLPIGFYLHLTEESESYINTHLSNYLDPDFEDTQGHLIHVMAEFCTGLIQWNQVQDFLQLPVNLTNDSFPLDGVVSILDGNDEVIPCYRKVGTNWYMPLFNDESVIESIVLDN
ncbi:hypothetical protein AB4452_04655 [Vibrio lentus]